MLKPQSRGSARLSPPRWRDPRVLIGVFLVLASIAGTWAVITRVAASVTVWSAVEPLVPGSVVEPEDVTAVEVRLADTAGLYLSVGAPIPAGSTVRTTIGAGELVPADAVVRPSDLSGRVVSVDVDGSVPADVARGSRVDLWATPVDTEELDPVRLLSGVDVISLERDTQGFASSGQNRLEVFVPEASVAEVLRAQARDDRIAVVAVPDAGEGPVEEAAPAAGPEPDPVTDASSDDAAADAGTTEGEDMGEPPADTLVDSSTPAASQDAAAPTEEGGRS